MTFSWKKALMLGASLLALGACGQGQTEQNQQEAKKGDQQALTVYTNSLDDEKEDWLAKRSKDAGFDVQFVKAGGGDTFNRIMAEKNDPQADVIIGLDEGQLKQIKEADLLAEFEPSWANDIPDNLKTGGKYYYPWTEQRIMAFYRADQVKDAPKKLEDFAKIPELEKKYAVPADMAGSTNQKIVFSILLQHLDKEGELGVSKEGWQAVKDYFDHGYVPTEGEDRHAKMGQGDLLASYYFSGGIPNVEKEFEFQATPVNPDYGVFSMSEQVAVVKKDDDSKLATAKKYADWWGSKETQEAWAKDFGTVPTLKSAQDAVAPRIKEIMTATDRMDVDWDIINEYADQWVEKIELDLLPAQ